MAGGARSPGGVPGSQGETEARAKDLEPARASYLSLQEEARAARASLPLGLVTRCEIVRPAVAPIGPFFPRPGLFALFGLVLGLAVGAGAAVAAAMADSSRKRRSGA